MRFQIQEALQELTAALIAPGKNLVDRRKCSGTGLVVFLGQRQGHLDAQLGRLASILDDVLGDGERCRSALSIERVPERSGIDDRIQDRSSSAASCLTSA